MDIDAPRGMNYVGLYQSGNQYEQRFNKLSIFYDFARVSDRVKITYKGNHNAKIQLPLNTNKQAFKDDARKIAKAQGSKRALSYDWSDAAGAVDINNSVIEFTPNGAFDIDPSIVGTTTSGSAGGYPNQYTSFYAHSKHWAFYSNGVNLLYSTSDDGSTWASASNVCAEGYSPNFSLWFNGSDVWVITSGSFRHGTPVANGTINWSAGIQTHGLSSSYSGITRSSTNNTYVGYQAADNKPKVARSDPDDGTWSTHASFPYELDGAGAPVDVTLVPFSDGKIYALWCVNGAPAKGKLYTEASDTWGDTEAPSGSSNVTSFRNFSTGILSDNTVVFAYMKSPGNSQYYRTRNATTGNWSNEVLINSTPAAIPAITVSPTYDVTRFYWVSNAAQGIISYKKLINGVFDANATIALDWTAAIPSNENFKMSRRSWSNVESVVFADSGTPTNMVYEFFTQPAITTNNATISVTKDGVTSGNWSVNLTDLGRATEVDVKTVFGPASDSTEPYSYASASNITRRNATGNVTTALPANLTVGGTYYYRAWADSWGFGSEKTFNVTMPTVTTVSASNTTLATPTLNGNITSLGVASDCYAAFEWGYSGSYGNTTSLVARNATGAYSATITVSDPTQIVYYRALVKVGSVYSYGAQMTFSPQTVAMTTNTDNIVRITPLILWVAFLIGGVISTLWGVKSSNWIALAVGLCMIILLMLFFPVAIDAVNSIRKVMS
jgi:hypothetical protein